jgi:hypothetical protein
MYGYSLGKDKAAIESGIEQAYQVFPRLSDRRNQLASTLSGGEQQMLGLSKALIISPRVLLIDEFSLGLAPVIVGQLMETVRRLNERGTAVLLVEQSVNVALSLVDRVYFMEKGRITYEGRAEDLRADPELVAALSMGGAHVEELVEHDGDDVAAAAGSMHQPEAHDVVGAVPAAVAVEGLAAQPAVDAGSPFPTMQPAPVAPAVPDAAAAPVVEPVVAPAVIAQVPGAEALAAAATPDGTPAHQAPVADAPTYETPAYEPPVVAEAPVYEAPAYTPPAVDLSVEPTPLAGEIPGMAPLEPATAPSGPSYEWDTIGRNFVQPPPAPVDPTGQVYLPESTPLADTVRPEPVIPAARIDEATDRTEPTA